MITDKHVMLISPANKIGGKATFTRVLLSQYKKDNINYTHIDLVRTKSNNKYFKYSEHIYSFFSYKIKLIKNLFTKRIDIIQIHASSYFDFYDISIFILISKLYNKKVILRCGGGGFPVFFNEAYYFNKKYIKKLLSSIDKVIVQSEYWKDYFSSLGVSSNNMLVMPNFVNDIQFNPEEKTYNSRHIHVLFVPGSSLEGKGFFDIKNNIIELAEKYPYITFHIVGPRVEDHLLADNITTCKKIYGEEKVNLFNKCHIFLLPTRVEGFPNALIEAMAAGMAVITTNIPQISCLAEDGKEFLLMNPGSSIEFTELFTGLMKDKNRIKELGANARKLVEEKYSKKLMPKYLKELYNG